MNEGVDSITLSEWETVSASTCSTLAGRFLDASVTSQRLVDVLNSSRMLRFTELKDGLKVSSFSHVGRVRIGDLNVTVLPKIKVASLLRLLRYAFGFRRVDLMPESSHLVDQFGFDDLLICQLNAEAQEIISRGLQRAYVRRDERLASPRGRISIGRVALDGGTVTASLPCQHFPRLEDTLLNRVLMAGLRLAGTVASHLELRRESTRLASTMEEQIGRITLTPSVLDHADRRLNRLTAAYVPSLKIIRLLFEAQGIVFEGGAWSMALPGFLFDMNQFFQALLSRFLRENLNDCTVRDEHGLKGMMRYNQAYNPQRKQSPTPRPDYAVLRQGKLLSLLDAKYRDLWERKLPREMLYQLVVYAISHRHQLQSSILYPTTNPLARESRIDVTDPIYGKHLAQVCLRPVNLDEFGELVSSKTAGAKREREAFAEQMAFGEASKIGQ